MSAFNFSNPAWLWALAIVPIVIALYMVFNKGGAATERLKSFADAHLLPHLILQAGTGRRRPRWPLLLWALAWLCGAFAMAGPRWNFTDVQTARPERALVILLDLSKSMDTADVKPSRVIRAREEISDILDASHDLNVGLVAFAEIPHMVAPLTDDMATIHQFLPYMDTGLIAIQGSRIAPALDMAAHLLQNAPGHEKSILIVSDGGFSDMEAARAALPAGVAIDTMGVGTEEGAPIPAADGGWIKDNDGRLVIAKLEAANLQALAAAGHGIYVRADYGDEDTKALMRQIEAQPEQGKGAPRTVRVWDEKFYIPVLFMALLLLPWFRKGYVFPVLMLLTLSSAPAQASWLDWFRNPAQQGQAAYNHGDYEAAAKVFDTPYRRGVAQYRAKQYGPAAQSFNAVQDPKIRAAAEYNLGNAQLQAGQPEEAIKDYEVVLKQQPRDAAAQHNLAIARKMLRQKQQQKQQNDQQRNQQQKSSQQNQRQAQNGQPQGGQGQSQSQSGQSGSSQQAQTGQQGQPQQADNKNSAAGQQEQPQQSTQANSQGRRQQAGKEAAQQNSGAPNSQGEQQSDQQVGVREQAPEGASPSGSQNAAQSQSASRSTPPVDQNNSAKSQPSSSSEAQSPAQQAGTQDNADTQNPPESQQDVDADQWLSRATSDPGPFLKNQFLLEARKSGAQPEDNPW